jgi:hypothetical protein
MKVLFNKFHRRINLMVLLFNIRGPGTQLRTQNFEISSLKGTSHTNSDSEWEIKALFNKYHRRKISGGTFVW